MLIPSIDLRNGKVVQLVQGERLALEDDDFMKWVNRFARYPELQLIDLDAAIGTGSNDELVARICGLRACRVGGGIRTIERARAVLAAGATHVIVGSSLFRDGAPDLEFAAELAAAIGPERMIAAIDAKGEVAMEFNSPGMYRACRVAGREPIVAIYGDEPKR